MKIKNFTIASVGNIVHDQYIANIENVQYSVALHFINTV